MKIIVYSVDGNVRVVFPSPQSDLTIDEIAKKDVPPGYDFLIIEEKDLPTGSEQGAWVIDLNERTVSTDNVRQKKIETDGANMLKSSLLRIASEGISPLQDAVDIDDATDAEIALLKKWKQYSVAVNRVDTSTAPDIVWPTPPAV